MVNRRVYGAYHTGTGRVEFMKMGHTSPAEAVEQLCFPWKVLGVNDDRWARPDLVRRIRTRENTYFSEGTPEFESKLGEALSPGGNCFVEVRLPEWEEQHNLRSDWAGFDPAVQFGGEGKPPLTLPGRRWVMDTILGYLVQEAIGEEVERMKIDSSRIEDARQEAIRVVGSQSTIAAAAATRKQRVDALITDLESNPRLDTHPAQVRLIP